MLVTRLHFTEVTKILHYGFGQLTKVFDSLILHLTSSRQNESVACLLNLEVSQTYNILQVENLRVIRFIFFVQAFKHLTFDKH